MLWVVSQCRNSHNVCLSPFPGNKFARSDMYSLWTCFCHDRQLRLSGICSGYERWGRRWKRLSLEHQCRFPVTPCDHMQAVWRTTSIAKSSLHWVHNSAIYRPRCDKCVVRFDHHDVFINNCIGYGNQHYYVLFLVFGIFACVAYFSLWTRIVSSVWLQPLNFIVVRCIVDGWLSKLAKTVYYFLNLRGMIPNVCRNITFYEAMNSFKLGYMKYPSLSLYNR